MATHDFSTVPAIVTITNISKEPQFLEMVSTPGFPNTPEEVKEKNMTATKDIQFFRTNLCVALDPEDEMRVVAQTSAELAYFMSLAVADKITVSAAAKN